MSPKFTAEEYEQGIRAGDRVLLAQAITLAESMREEDKVLAKNLLKRLLPYTGHSLRIGITGIPGVGKSTFIEALGKELIKQGKKPAVTAVDPSGEESGGSILADKTRMQELSVHPSAFVRPSPSRRTLGGVSDTTHEVIMLMESAGYDVILIETVGVGQSEVLVKNICDIFLLLVLPGAGDELQGIKRGITEEADLVIVNKADDDLLLQAKQAQTDYSNALKLLRGHEAPPVLLCSSLHDEGIAEAADLVFRFEKTQKESGLFDARRAAQQATAIREKAEKLLLQDFSRWMAKNEYREDIKKLISGEKLLPEEIAAIFARCYKERSD